MQIPTHHATSLITAPALTSCSWLRVEQSSSHDSSCGRSEASVDALRPSGEGRWCWKECEGDSGEPSGLHKPVAASSAGVTRCKSDKSDRRTT